VLIVLRRRDNRERDREREDRRGEEVFIRAGRRVGFK
jgi:hypothetical protein